MIEREVTIMDFFQAEVIFVHFMPVTFIVIFGFVLDFYVETVMIKRYGLAKLNEIVVSSVFNLLFISELTNP